MSDGIILRSSGGGTEYAFIVADWPVGSRCQIVRSSDGRTIKAKDTSGHFVFRLPKLSKNSLYDEWEVSCTTNDGSDDLEANKTVTITYEGQSAYVYLSYAYELIYLGAKAEGIELVSTSGTLTEKYDGKNHARWTPGNSKAGILKSPKIDLTPYSKIILVTDGGYSWYTSSGYVPAVGCSNENVTVSSYVPTPVTKAEYITKQTGYWNSQLTIEVDISSVNKEQIVWISASYNSSTQPGYVDIVNWYLER